MTSHTRNWNSGEKKHFSHIDRTLGVDVDMLQHPVLLPGVLVVWRLCQLQLPNSGNHLSVMLDKQTCFLTHHFSSLNHLDVPLAYPWALGLTPPHWPHCGSVPTPGPIIRVLESRTKE